MRRKEKQTAYVRSSSPPIPLFRSAATFKHAVRNLGEISVANALSGGDVGTVCELVKKAAASL